MELSHLQLSTHCLSWDHPYRSMGVYLEPAFYLTPKCDLIKRSRFSLISFITNPKPLAQSLMFPTLPGPLTTQKISSIYLFQGNPCIPVPLWPSLVPQALWNCELQHGYTLFCKPLQSFWSVSPYQGRIFFQFYIFAFKFQNIIVSFLQLSNTSLCFFICSLVKGRLCCCQFLTIMNNTAYFISKTPSEGSQAAKFTKDYPPP